MIVTGALIAFAALAAAWVRWAPLPRFEVGERGYPEPVLRPMSARWRPFSAAALAEAKRLDRLVLLSLTARWSREAAVMDGTTFADPDVTRLLERELIAVRVDADERPDLALRYLGKGWPTTALLLPTGEVLADGTYMDAATLTRWVEAIVQKFRSRRAGVYDAASAAARRRFEQTPAGDPAQALARSRRPLEATWDGPALFPRFDRLLALTRLRADWAPAAVRRGAAKALELQDADGGFFRARGWSKAVAREKRLADQADALAFLALQNPDAAARLRTFVHEKLALPGGGYRAAIWPEGRDERVFADESGRMAAAVLLDPGSSQAQKAHARKTIARLAGLRTRPAGLLGDRLGLAEALAAAGRPRETLRALGEPEGPAYLDRPATGELPADLDRIPFAALNARAWRLLRGLGETRRAQALARWLWEHPQGLDAGDLAELSERGGYQSDLPPPAALPSDIR